MNINRHCPIPQNKCFSLQVCLCARFNTSKTTILQFDISNNLNISPESDAVIKPPHQFYAIARYYNIHKLDSQFADLWYSWYVSP